MTPQFPIARSTAAVSPYRAAAYRERTWSIEGVQLAPWRPLRHEHRLGYRFWLAAIAAGIVIGVFGWRMF
jgi:hypothetical protein